TQAELRKISARDSNTFARVDAQLKKLARYLQPFFLEPPPEFEADGLQGWWKLLRVGRRFRGITSGGIAQLISFLTGSLGEFLDRNYESEKVKTLFLANNVYGKHGGPYDPGTALGLLFHLLSGGEHELQGFYGQVSQGSQGNQDERALRQGESCLGRGAKGARHATRRGPRSAIALHARSVAGIR